MCQVGNFINLNTSVNLRDKAHFLELRWNYFSEINLWNYLTVKETITNLILMSFIVYLGHVVFLNVHLS